MRREMKADFDYSKERDYEDREDFFGKFGLSEHFYGEDADSLLEPAIEKVCGNLDRFIASPWNEKVQDYYPSMQKCNNLGNISFHNTLIE